MLINVTKSELKNIVLNLWMHRKSDTKTNEVYEKLKPLLEVCDCQGKNNENSKSKKHGK